MTCAAIKDIMAMAAPPDSPEVTRLETDRTAIFEGLRRGFARAYDCLVEDPNEWKNLADDPAFSKVKATLKESLLSLTGRGNE